MILHIIVLVLVQKMWLVKCECKHSYWCGLQEYYSDYRHNCGDGATISNCSIKQLYNPSDQYIIRDLLNSQDDYSVYWKNTITITIQNSLINNFSASTFITDRVACYYGKIKLVVANSHVKHIDAFPMEILKTYSNNKVSGPKCNVSYDSIDFSNNNITKFDAQIFNNFSNLTTLNLANNNIIELGKLQFDNLPNLTTLNVSNNNISSIDIVFGKLDKLNTLDLSRNNLRNLSKSAFVNITSLQFLDLSYNLITNITSGMFIYLNYLSSLDISHNQLTTINIGTFSGLQNLNTLFISHNRIVPNKYLMINSPQMYGLDLSYNELQYLNLNIFNDHQLQSINIDGNKFSCQQLIHYINKFKKMGTILQYGTETDRLSLRGIHCNDTESNEDITIDIASDNNASNDFTTFFNQGFKQTTFYKFFNNFAVDRNKAVDDGAYADAMKSLENSSKNIVSALNSTMGRMLMELQVQNKNKDDERKSEDVDTERAERSKFLQLFGELQTELKRFDKSSDKLNQLVSEKYVQTAQLPVDHVQGIFNLLIVIMCFIGCIAVMMGLNLFLKKGGAWRPLRRNNVNIDDGVSRSEFCSMTDTL